MINWIIPLVVGILVAGAGLIVLPLLRSKFRGVNQQASNSKLDALSPDPKNAPPTDQNIVSDPKNWLPTLGREAMRIVGWIAVGIITGVFLLIVIVLLLRAMLS